MAAKSKQSSSSGFFDDSNSSGLSKGEIPPAEEPLPPQTAIVYWEGNFKDADRETEKALLAYLKKYRVLSIIDDEKAGKDAGKVLGGEKSGLPIYRDLGTALAQCGRPPQNLIFAVTHESGTVTDTEKRLLLRALGYGINIVSEIHELLNGDPELVAACEKKGSSIRGC